MSSNLPEKFTYPFCYTPHPLIVKAAESLCRRIASDPDLAPLFAPGKMLGVLMVAKGDEVDFLFGFSGLVGGRSLIDGFVPPIFDTASVDINSSSHEESIRLQNWLFEQYVVSNGLGERLSVLNIFARRGLMPPGGTGDCAAPKLLQYAYSHNLKPLAMGEFWYGASPRGEVRRHGCFYPSCTGKCGPLLGFMLQGLDVEPNPLDNDNLWSLSDPVVKYEDSDIIIVDKPSGMLSVPGRTSRRSLQDWLSDYCGCTIYACHRLDMDTSGLMVFAKTPEAQENIQRQFENREVRKQYLAHLCPAAGVENVIEAVGKDKLGETGEPSEAAGEELSQHPALKPGDTGKISLPLILDYYDRPRQKVDFAEGKPAVTGYEILRELPGGCLEVRFTPFTGRTHQLRVHAAHALGLGRPILGDRLYGGHCSSRNTLRPIQTNRLMLHASLLSFRHPTTGSRLHFTSDTLPERD